MNNQQHLLQVAESYLDAGDALPWLRSKVDKLQKSFQARDFFLAFSACSRFIARNPLDLAESHLAQLQKIYPNFGAATWSTDELARVILMTAIPVADNLTVLDKLFGTADYREQVAAYKGLYFLDNAARFTERAREGLRTNMVGVFDAIALDNPYPYDYLSEDAWNQMVLKAMFMDRPIYRIYRIEDRKNEKLTHMFIDYAHERWSAHRTVSPELWRFVSGFVRDQNLGDLQKAVLEGSPLERQAAARAIAESDHTAGHSWLQLQNIDPAQLPDWTAIGKAWENQQMTTA